MKDPLSTACRLPTSRVRARTWASTSTFLFKTWASSKWPCKASRSRCLTRTGTWRTAFTSRRNFTASKWHGALVNATSSKSRPTWLSSTAVICSCRCHLTLSPLKMNGSWSTLCCNWTWSRKNRAEWEHYRSWASHSGSKLADKTRSTVVGRTLFTARRITKWKLTVKS